MNDNPIEFLFGFVFAVHSANLERLMKTFGEVKRKWSEKNRSYSSTRYDNRKSSFLLVF